jgi:hypothetical protein
MDHFPWQWVRAWHKSTEGSKRRDENQSSISHPDLGYPNTLRSCFSARLITSMEHSVCIIPRGEIHVAARAEIKQEI